MGFIPTTPTYKGVITEIQPKSMYNVGRKPTKIGKVSLWRQNDSKANQPSYKGNITINGTKYSISLW